MEGWIDPAAVDLVGQLLDQIGNALELRMNGERAAEGVERALVVAELLQDDAEPGERAEMARLARQHLADVGDGAAEILLRVIDGGAPVPGLDEIRLDVDDGVEQLDGEIEVLAVDRGLDPTHQQIGGIARGGEPDRPDAVLDVFGALVVGRDLERLEQAVEIFRLVAALDARQRRRRLDRLGRLGIDRFGQRRQGRSRRQGQSRGENRRRHENRESLLPMGSRLTPTAAQ